LSLSEQGNGVVDQDPPTSTFVLRFWREWSAAEPRWRGQIDHVQSGESARFLDLEEMLAVLERYGVIPPGTGRSIST
jgi:hypothetical protein